MKQIISPWIISFHGNVGRDLGNKHVGFYVSRIRPDWVAPNAKEWILDTKGKLKKFSSRECAEAAIASK